MKPVVRLRGALLVVVLGLSVYAVSSAYADQPLAAAAAQARTEARKWQSDAMLVQIELTGFGFATGPSGIPDMTRAGPPRLAMFKFLSPSSPGAVLRVSVRINETELPPAQQQARIAMGYRTVMVDVLPPPAPSTLPIPPSVGIDLQPAIATAQKDIARECSRGDPQILRTCALVGGAELHMHPRNSGDTVGTPAWTIRFGQPPRFLDTVSRVVDATSLQIVARNVDSRWPTGIIPALHARVVGLRFFVAGASLPPPAERNYDDLFFYNAARYIHWELQLAHPPLGPRHPLTITDAWELARGLGGILHRETRTVTLEGHWTASWASGSANLMGTKAVRSRNPLYNPGECARQRERGGGGTACDETVPVEIRFWSTGAYRVDLFVDRQLVASGTFEMRAKEDIYGKVAAKARDRSSPIGTIPALEARVASLRFFEAGDVLPPAANQRRHATTFPQAGTRNIFWQVDLAHEAPERWIPVTFEALLYFTDAGRERVIQRKVFQAAVPGDWSNTSYADWFGWSNDYYWDRGGSTTRSPRRWLPGTYRVDLYVADQKVASGSFEIH
jgi:hypothetical protein